MIVLLGDSMIKNIPVWNVGKELGRRFVIKPFPGARIRDMKHYLKPMLNQKPDEIVLHCGTNDLRDMEPKVIAEGLVDIARSVGASSSTKVTISELVTRANPSLDAKAAWPSICEILSILYTGLIYRMTHLNSYVLR